MPAAETSSRARPWWEHPLIKAALFVSLAFGLWWLLADIDLTEAAAILRQAHPLPVVLACAANLLSQATRALGWAVLLADYRIPFPRLVRFELTAQGASAVTPEGSGELIRLAQLRAQGVPAATTLSVIAVRKLLSSVGLIPLLAFLLRMPPQSIPPWGDVVVVAYLLSMTLLLVALLAVAHRVPPVGRAGGTPLGLSSRLRGVAERLHGGVAPLRRPFVLIASLGAAVLTRLLDCAAAVLIMAGLGMPVSPTFAVFTLLLVEISNVLPTAPGQLGSFEAAVLSAAAGFVPGEQAVAFALLLHAQQVLPQASAAAVIALVETVRGRDERPQGTHREGAWRG